ncbi:MAG: hypothetical protein WBA93_26435 [Microcoleaceae cyanobacterium]
MELWSIQIKTAVRWANTNLSIDMGAEQLLTAQQQERKKAVVEGSDRLLQLKSN